MIMPRTSIRTFLSTVKRRLPQLPKETGQVHFAIGNESADLDSITCALVYGYLQSQKPQFQRHDRNVIPVTNIPRADLDIRPELTALLKHADLEPSELITVDDIPADSLPVQRTEWTLVDHNGFAGRYADRYADRVVAVIDHHQDDGKVPKDAKPRVIEKCGSCGSLVVNWCRESWESMSSKGSSQSDDAGTTSLWDAQVAKLALGSILVDTVNMTAESKITEHDREAVKYLENVVRSSQSHVKPYDRDSFFKEIDNEKSNLDSLSIDGILRKDYKQWTEGDLTLGVSTVVQSIEYLKNKETNLDDVLTKFARARSLSIYAVMTAFNDQSGNFSRQLLLMALEGGKAIEAAERFVSQAGDEIELVNETTPENSSAAFVHMWNQNNLKASRKQVAPLLRKAML